MYHATVPVFRHYLAQMAGIVDKAGREAMTAQIADSLTASQHFATAAGFTLRITCPLAGRPVPDLPTALAPRMAVARATLGAMKVGEFDGAADRIISHRAGFTDVTQSAHDFVFLYGLPNFFFHITMGYAALRNAGADIGKADFDGFHSYPPDFSFE
ncbi:MAG: DUF1993 family protein [Paracoccaceae bacterium]